MGDATKNASLFQKNTNTKNTQEVFNESFSNEIKKQKN